MKPLFVALGAFLMLPTVASAQTEVTEIDYRIEAAPYDVALRLDRADLLLTHGRFEEALVDCEVASQMAPKNADVALTFGRIHFAMGELGKAETFLTAHLRTPHPSPEAYLLRGRIREKTGRFEEALADYEAARMLKLLTQRRSKNDKVADDVTSTYHYAKATL